MRTLSQELQARGFVHQFTGESAADLAAILDGEKRVIYHGIDPSADSAHAGNMVIWMLLRHLSDAGHKIIFLVGGGTGMIGDPKPDSERVLQDLRVVERNVANIKAQAQRLIGGDYNIEFVNNADWLLTQNLITFLRDVGKHFTVNELIKKEAIASRLESETGLSYTEFAYPILQGFDYLTLYREKNCSVQVGGSDQWGNIIAGVDLIRRMEQQPVHAITTPLVTDKVTGKKFGKSEGNAVWLDAEKTSPYAFYQFWLNVSDENVSDYLKLYTFRSLEDIATLNAAHAEDPGARTAQRALAQAVTTIVHGAVVSKQAERVSEVLFGEGTVADLSAAEKTMVLKNAPTLALQEATTIIELLVASGLASSKREARTFIEAGAVTAAGEKVTDVDYVLELPPEGVCPLRRGKKQFVILYRQ